MQRKGKKKLSWILRSLTSLLGLLAVPVSAGDKVDSDEVVLANGFFHVDDKSPDDEAAASDLKITKTKTMSTIGFNRESTYDWKTSMWSVPVNLTVSQMLKLGNQSFQIGAGVRC